MLHLHDWLTTAQIPFHSKLTDTKDWYLHDHTFFEIFYMLDGTMVHTLNGVTETLTPGDVYFLKPEDTHIFLREKGNTARHRDIVLRKSFFKSICNFVEPNLYNNFIENKYKKKISIPIKEMNFIESSLQDIATLPLSRSDLILSSARTVSAELLNQLLLHQKAEHLSYPEWFQELLFRLNNSELIKLGLNEILSPFYYTKEYICRSFKKYMNMTLTDYLNDQRLALAAQMLTYTNTPILMICTDIGFSSVSYFNKIFKEKFSCTPLAFRKKQL